MAHCIKLFGFLVTLCIVVVTIQGRPQDATSPAPVIEKSTWNKIVDGAGHAFNVAYDEVHCGFHKVKELVKSHDHEEGSDPCKDKPYQQTSTSTTSTTSRNIDLSIEDVVPVTTTSRPL